VSGDSQDLFGVEHPCFATEGRLRLFIVEPCIATGYDQQVPFAHPE
jgi:hypothetical protein